MSITRICVTVSTLKKPEAIAGQIKIEESLGNKVYLYPRDSSKILGSVETMTDEHFQAAMGILSRVYGNWKRSSWDNARYYEMVAKNIRRIKDTATLDMYLTQFAKESGEIDFLDEQALHYAGYDRKGTYEARNKYVLGLRVLMRTKDLQNRPAVIKAMMAGFNADTYVLMEMIRKLRGSSPTKRQFYEKWKAVWDARLQAGPPIHGEIETIFREFSHESVLSCDKDGIKLSFVYKDLDKEDAELAAKTANALLDAARIAAKPPVAPG